MQAESWQARRAKATDEWVKNLNLVAFPVLLSFTVPSLYCVVIGKYDESFAQSAEGFFVGLFTLWVMNWYIDKSSFWLRQPGALMKERDTIANKISDGLLDKRRLLKEAWPFMICAFVMVSCNVVSACQIFERN